VLRYKVKKRRKKQGPVNSLKPVVVDTLCVERSRSKRRCPAEKGAMVAGHQRKRNRERGEGKKKKNEEGESPQYGAPFGGGPTSNPWDRDRSKKKGPRRERRGAFAGTTEREEPGRNEP